MKTTCAKNQQNASPPPCCHTLHVVRYPFVLRGIRLIGVDATLPWNVPGYPGDVATWRRDREKRLEIWRRLDELKLHQAQCVCVCVSLVVFGQRVLLQEWLGWLDFGVAPRNHQNNHVTSTCSKMIQVARKLRTLARTLVKLSGA